MTPTTKEAQRAELHKTIWRIANDLRGSVDGWDFKSYVLGMLFYRYISENLTAYINQGEHDAGVASFDYAALTDRQAEFGRKETVAEKGFYILPSELFANVRARAAQDANLNETLESVFKDVEGSAKGTDSEDDLKGLFDDLNVNNSKLGNTVANRNACLVPHQTIAANDYNIAVSWYVEAENTTEAVDITELNAEIARIVARQAELHTSIDEIVADLEAGV